MSDLQSKSDEELNRMLASLHFPQFPVFVAENGELRHHYDVGRSGPAFNYCSSLDAVATVEAGLTDEQKLSYIEALCQHPECNLEREMWRDFWHVATASARQRAEALYHTLNPKP